ncbi:MAG: two-component system response regulator [Ilumatobacteraceae bacterium]|nr:two-component system response regulator [Ilumatobacteraceae bacterium]
MSDDHAPTRFTTARSREALIISTFVSLADTMIDEYDVIEFLGLLAERCVELLDTVEAGIMLADERGNLQAVAASSERTRLLELFELQNEEGPCLDAFRTGEIVMSADLAGDLGRWPRFAARARADGFASVVSLPLRLRREIIGALNLLSDDHRPLSADDVALAGALADVATIGLLQERTVRESRTSAGQLQMALTSRVLIEQAKGVIAARRDIDIDAAFEVLRGYARRHGRKLTEVARAVVHDQFVIDEPGPSS